ncbi:leucine-rich repeat domain-containing protein [Mycetocola spongiae]|uniref:leucine-rich repeat domain-containing protein n=1 Tax=Mycetocola spongiae TaxID=2859226 RepID=UPI001CF3106D|nr:leucine-rich repeat domain-containing protein [Mycetocola spongiae]UCR88817.1 hypothetical protein KXZ72_12815 [Mycetocola spongiae]
MRLTKMSVVAATIAAAALLTPAGMAQAIGAPAAAGVTSIPLGQGGPESDPVARPDIARSAQARAALPDDNELVNMPDAALSAAILQKTQQPTLTRGVLRSLRDLMAPDAGITDLTGLEYASQLDLVDLSKNPITTLEPMRGLTEIRQLNVSSTAITSLDPLSTLPILDYVRFNWTKVADLEPLRNATKLWRIEAAGTQITSIDPVQNLNELIGIYLQETGVSDLSPLAGKPKLNAVSAPSTEVSDLSPLAGSTTLSIINVNGARVSDLSMLDTWPALRQVGFLNQRVTGIPVVASATESTYRTTQATTAPFTMLPGVVLNATSEAITTPEGLTIWSDIPADATALEAQISGNPLPGSTAGYSATLSYPITRADYINADLPNTTVGADYQFQLAVTPSFVDGPFSVTAGEIPGLGLDAEGAITGTPTEEGTFPLSVRRTDAYGNMIDHTYNVVVGAGSPVIPPVTPTDPPVAPTDPATPPVTPEAGGLAQTGANLPAAGLLLGVLASLAAGLGAVFYARRRRLG